VLESSYVERATLEAALQSAVDALGRDGSEPRTLTPSQLEVAVLDRTRTQARKFRRIVGPQLGRLLGQSDPAPEPSGSDAAPVSDEDVLGAVDDVLEDGSGES
jgi:proteasome alpha subunit